MVKQKIKYLTVPNKVTGSPTKSFKIWGFIIVYLFSFFGYFFLLPHV